MIESVKIKDICKITNGYAFKSDKYVKNDGARVIRITNVQKGKVVDNDPKLYPFSELISLDNYKLFEGDILMSLTGNVGRVGKFPINLLPAYINQRVCRVKSNSNNLLENYLFHFLNSDVFESEAIRNSAGAAQLNLSTKWVSDFEIPLPPLPQQQRIAKILDAADALRQNDKALIAKYDELTQALFLDMFGDPVSNPKGWDVNPLGEFISIKHGFAFKSDYFVERSDFTLLTPGNFMENGGYKDQRSKQKYYDGEIPNGYILKEGDILIAMTEQAAGLLGSTLFVPSSGTYLHNQRLGLINYGLELCPMYIYSVFNQKSIRTRIHADATGSKVRHTSPSKMMNIEIGFPPVDLQNQFAERVAAIEEQKAIAQKSLIKSDELFNSLLQKAFKGELV